MLCKLLRALRDEAILRLAKHERWARRLPLRARVTGRRPLRSSWRFVLTRVAHSSEDAQHMRRSSTYSTSRPTIQDPTVMSSLAYLHSAGHALS